MMLMTWATATWLLRGWRSQVMPEVTLQDGWVSALAGGLPGLFSGQWYCFDPLMAQELQSLRSRTRR